MCQLIEMIDGICVVLHLARKYCIYKMTSQLEFKGCAIKTYTRQRILRSYQKNLHNLVVLYGRHEILGTYSYQKFY